MPGPGRRGPSLWPVLLFTFALLVASCSSGPLSASNDDVSSSEGSGTGSNADLQPDSDGRWGRRPTTPTRMSPTTWPTGARAYWWASFRLRTTIWCGAHFVEPVSLAVTDPVEGGLFTTSWIREGLLEGLYRSNGQWEQVPELLASDATVTVDGNNSVSISYTLRSGLTWSDGEPLTAADVEYTHRILMEGCLTEADGSAIDVSNEGCVYPMADRTGYDLVTSFNVVDDTTFTIAMAAFYPDWRSLYPQILAAHAFGDDAAAVAANLETMTVNGRPLPSSGPLVMESWVDHSLRMKANDAYHGSVLGESAGTDDGDGGGGGGRGVAGVQVNFVRDAVAAVDAVEAGSADVAFVGADLANLDGLGSEGRPGGATGRRVRTPRP